MLINNKTNLTKRFAIGLALLIAVLTGQATAEVTPERAGAPKPLFISAFAGIDMTAALLDNAKSDDQSSELESWTHMEASLWEGQCGSGGLSYVFSENDVFMGYRCN